MSILQTTELKKYYGTEPNITKALDGTANSHRNVTGRSYFALENVGQDFSAPAPVFGCLSF